MQLIAIFAHRDLQKSFSLQKAKSDERALMNSSFDANVVGREEQRSVAVGTRWKSVRVHVSDEVEILEIFWVGRRVV